MSDESQPGEWVTTPPDGVARNRVPPRRGPDRAGTPAVALVARVIVGAAVLGLCVVVVGWWAIGGRWFIVRTPSMATYAPVGTLVWVRPTQISDLHVGDVITFHPPALAPGVFGRAAASDAAPSETVTHRVFAVERDGTVETKGDLNGVRDPWRINQAHLVGRVIVRMPGVGWLVKAFPVLLPGLAALVVLTGLFASKRLRAPLRIVGAAVLVAAAIYVYNPLFGAMELGFASLGGRGAEATYVGTGLMPVQLRAQGVPTVVIHPGQKRSIVSTHLNPHHQYQVHVVPTVPWEIWALILAASLAPAVWSVIVGVEPPSTVRGREKKQTPGSNPTTQQLQPS